MLLSLIFAVLAGFFIRKRWWGAAAFCGMMFLYFLWLALLVILNIAIVGQRMNF